MKPERKTGAHVALLLGLVLVSTAGPFIEMARMDAFQVVLGRLIGAGFLFLLIARFRDELPRLFAGRIAERRRRWQQLSFGAALLAAHFVLWVKAFDLTDFSSNLLLLVMQPVIAALLGIRLGEHPTRSNWIAIGLALVGLTVIAGGDFALGPRALLGDLMCILADLAIAAFYVVTIEERRELPLAAFMAVTFLIGALLVAPLVIASGAPSFTALPRASWGWLLALVLVTTMAGHGLTNLAARKVRLFTLNVVIVAEPAIGILFAALLFGASVSALQVGGGLILAVAVVIGLRE